MVGWLVTELLRSMLLVVLARKYQLQCRSSGNCQMTKTTRSTCHACCYNKCKAVGMMKRSVARESVLFAAMLQGPRSATASLHVMHAEGSFSTPYKVCPIY